MQETTTERFAGLVLISGGLIGVLVMVFHPTGHDLRGDDIAAAALRNRIVHGAAIGLMGWWFVGLLGLRRAVAGRNWSTVAIVAQAIGLIGAIAAGVASGLVSSELFERLAAADDGDRTAVRDQLRLTHMWNQAFANVYVCGFSVGMLAWAVDLGRHGRSARFAARFGAVAGALVLLAQFSGHLSLGVHGFGAVVLVHTVWMIWSGVLLARKR